MTPRRKVWVLAAALLAILIGAGIVMWQSVRQADPTGSLVSHARLPEGFIDDAACAECHADVADQFRRSGMGRSWQTWAKAEPIEDRTTQPVADAGNLRYYVEFEGGKHFLRETLLGADGTEQELQRREVAYTLGSGTHGRSYITSEKGYLTLMPVGWYSTRSRWDMSPGYAQSNQRFLRRVAPACISCHAAMVAYEPGSTCAYTDPMPSLGIGCQRCHGPGEQHVLLHRRSNEVDPATDPIVRPPELSLEAQQDLCLQCHLQGDVALLQPGCDASSYRPGMRLRDVRTDFYRAASEQNFQAVGHGPRSMASACYKKSNGRMTCIFCHDPHRPAKDFSAAYYNERCLDCHAKKPCNRPPVAGHSANEGNCISCHMPTKPASDIPHAVSTEHWIHRPGKKLGSPVGAPITENGLASFWPDVSEGQVGAAYVEAFSQTGHADQIQFGVAKLAKAVEQRPDAVDWRYYLALGYHELGRWQDSADTLSPILHHSDFPVEGQALFADALLRLDRKAEAQTALEDLLRRWPWYPDVDAALARLYLDNQEPKKVTEAHERYFRHHLDNSSSLEFLAVASKQLDRPADEIERLLERAIRADGTKASPYLFRASLAIERGDQKAIESALQAALRVEPASPAARVAWTRYLLSQGRRDEAIGQLQFVLLQHPDYVPARQLLNQVLR